MYPTQGGSETVKVPVALWYGGTMTKSRTMSMELRAIRQQLLESPPPPPSGATVREWFAGLALMNPELMKGLTSTEQVAEAVRLADELIRALRPALPPSADALSVPQGEEELTRSWNDMATAMKAADKKEKQDRVTAPDRPAIRRETAAYDFRHATIPPPPVTQPTIHFRRASDMLAKAAAKSGLPFPSLHSSLHPETEE